MRIACQPDQTLIWEVLALHSGRAQLNLDASKWLPPNDLIDAPTLRYFLELRAALLNRGVQGAMTVVDRPGQRHACTARCVAGGDGDQCHFGGGQQGLC